MPTSKTRKGNLTYGDIRPEIRNYIGVWEALRKLGFPSDDIYCALHFSPELNCVAAFCSLRTQGKEFNVVLAPIKDEEAFMAEHRRVLEAILANKVEGKILDRIWQESPAFKDKTGFLAAILSKGIKMPGPTQN